jgi:dTDP-4-amino-4,6-dideoxygalactose transaminase
MLHHAALPVVESLNRVGVQSRPLWTPLYDLPVFAGKSMVHSCDFAREFHQRALSLPSSSSITHDDLEYVTRELGRLL